MRQSLSGATIVVLVALSLFLGACDSPRERAVKQCMTQGGMSRAQCEALMNQVEARSQILAPSPASR
jgi:hypothetical protein